MVYLLALIGTVAALFWYREFILAMPAWLLLTPKALLLVDVQSLPVVSVYKYLCALIIFIHIIRIALKAEPVKNNYPFSLAFLCILVPGFAAVLGGMGTPNAGVLTLVTIILEVALPVTIYCHYLSQVRRAKYEELVKLYIVCGTLLAVYGTICYLIKFNPYIEIIQSTTHTGRVVAQTYEETVRGLRAQGTISHPITYGAVIVTLLYTYLIFKMRQASFSLKDYTWVGGAALIALAALLFSNSRTPLVMYVVPIVVFSLLIGGFRAVKYIFSFAAIFVLGFFAVPVFRDKILSIANIFNPNVGVDQNGSSISMREQQFSVSAKYFSESPIWGGGLDYSRNIVESGLEPDLYNTESIVFRLMIDQGLMGIIGYIVFFVMLYWVVAKVLVNRSARLMYLGFVVSYALFVISTGTMDTLQHVMLMASFLYYVGKSDMRNLHRQGTGSGAVDENRAAMLAKPLGSDRLRATA